jgi:hypothetical protein
MSPLFWEWLVPLWENNKTIAKASKLLYRLESELTSQLSLSWAWNEAIVNLHSTYILPIYM